MKQVAAHASLLNNAGMLMYSTCKLECWCGLEIFLAFSDLHELGLHHLWPHRANTPFHLLQSYVVKMAAQNNVKSDKRKVEWLFYDFNWT